MIDPEDPHAPTDEFVRYLARDIRRELRHEARFTASRSPWTGGRSSRGLATTATIAAGGVLALLTGIVLGASANHAAAAAPSDEHSRFALAPIRDAFQVIGCAAVPAGPPASRNAEAASRARGVGMVDLPAPVARGSQTMGAVLGVVETADGRLLVNDAARRQLRVFESDLGTSAIALDSTRGARGYGLAGPGTIGGTRGAKFLFRFVGDSSVLGPDGPPDHSLTVLDEYGRPARTIATASLALPPGIADGVAFFDRRGRLVYRHSPTVTAPTVVEVPLPPRRPDGLNPFGGRGAASSSMRLIVGRPDTLPIIRVDFETREIDTVAHIALPPDDPPGINGVGNGGGKLVPVAGADGRAVAAKQVIDPLPVIDDWAVLADGTIGIVRGRDYHVDWIHPDGRRSATPPLPYEWQRLSDQDRRRLVDSTRAVVDSLDALAETNALRDLAASDSVRNAPRPAAGAGRGGGRGGSRGTGTGGAPPASTQRAAAVLRAWPYEIVPPSQLPDRYPPIRAGSVRADADGNLWILPRAASAGDERTYDVVNPRDGLVRRVRIPSGRTIAGFGKGGVVYLTASAPDGAGVSLERTVVPRGDPR